MKTVTVEDYAIQLRTGRSYLKGIENFRGKKRKIWGYKEYCQTNVGEFERGEWIKITREIIEISGESELLERIKNRCRKCCAWPHKESDIDEYAMNCLTSRAYRHWDERKELEPEVSPVHMIFLFPIDS